MTACSINYSIGFTISGFSPLVAEILAKNFKYGLQYFLIATLILLIFGFKHITQTHGYKEAKLQDPTL